jgi:hypothetical protein
MKNWAMGIVPLQKKKQGYCEKKKTKQFSENISQKRFRKFCFNPSRRSSDFTEAVTSISIGPGGRVGT